MYEKHFLSHPFYTIFLRNDFRFDVHTIYTEHCDDFHDQLFVSRTRKRTRTRVRIKITLENDPSGTAASNTPKQPDRSRFHV